MPCKEVMLITWAFKWYFVLYFLYLKPASIKLVAYFPQTLLTLRAKLTLENDSKGLMKLIYSNHIILNGISNYELIKIHSVSATQPNIGLCSLSIDTY